MKPIWHVTGALRYMDDSGWHAIKCDVGVAGGDDDYAIDEAIKATCPTIAYDSNTEDLHVVELTGAALAEYERQQAERCSRQYGMPLFPVEVQP